MNVTCTVLADGDIRRLSLVSAQLFARAFPRAFIAFSPGLFPPIVLANRAILRRHKTLSVLLEAKAPAIAIEPLEQMSFPPTVSHFIAHQYQV